MATNNGPLWKPEKRRNHDEDGTRHRSPHDKGRGRWAKVRKRYLEKHVIRDPYDHWICAGCGKWLDKDSVTVDHILRRGSHSELKYDESNFQILCWNPCHLRKDFGMNIK